MGSPVAGYLSISALLAQPHIPTSYNLTVYSPFAPSFNCCSFTMASKTLNFYSYDLMHDTTVMLLFNPPNSQKLFVDQYPVVWKVIAFRARGHGKATVKYVNRLGFGYAQTDADNLVDSAAWTEVKSGDMTCITGGANEKRFGKTIQREDTKLLVCKNNSSGRADLSIGFVKGDGINQRYEPTLVWTGVGAKSNITAKFTPVITAYVTRQYQASQLLRGAVETDAIWECNLNELNDVTGWNFIEDTASGSFSIEPASGA
ncbi:hypothetical protein FS749_008867 [Ceratobasidium sp. UAMH 11750]|nr:hypothetical protein FS749_008867 [Ceratobasidium sp. UAMH 11750]